MLKYFYIFIILYNLNLVLSSFVNLMIKNITLFNYKNTTQFTKNKFFFDIIFLFYNYENNYAQINLAIAKRE